MGTGDAVDLSGGSAPANNAGFGHIGGYGGGAPAATGGGGGFSVGNSGGYAGGSAGGYGGSTAFGGHVAQAALNNSVIQQQLQSAAYSSAQQGFQVARDGAVTAVQQIHGYMQEGPAGVSILCFLGGLATTVIGILGTLNVTASLASPFQYLLNIYLTIFGIVTFLLEADLEALKNIHILGRLAPFVESYQMEVFNRANFLTELRGRGLYYIFVGSLAVTQCVVCLLGLVGIWNIVMGVCCVCMSIGINPIDHIQLSPDRRAAQDMPLVEGGHGQP